MLELIAEGDSPNINSIANYESKFAEGDKGQLNFYVNKDMTSEEVSIYQNLISKAGVKLTSSVTCEGRVLSIPFQKAIAPLVIIIGIIVLIIAIIIGWQLFKEKKPITEVELFGIPIWVLGVGALGILLLLISKPGQGQTPVQVFVGSGEHKRLSQ